MTTLKSLTLTANTIDDFSLRGFRKLTDLETLSLTSMPRISGVGFTGLTEFTNLRRLSLNSMAIDPGPYFYELFLFTLNLRHLNIWNSKKLFPPKANLDFISHLTRLEYLSIDDADTLDSGFHAIHNLRKLTKLETTNCHQMADGTVLGFSALEELEELLIRDCPLVTSTGYAALKHLTTLRSLNFLRSKGFDGSSMKYIRDLKGLTFLELTYTSIGQDAFEDSYYPRLETLYLPLVPLSLKSVQAIGAMKTLRTLSLTKCTVTDEGVDAISGLTNLTLLSLESNRITNKGIGPLTSLTSLSSLNIGGNLISNQGLKILCKHLKKLTHLYFIDTTINFQGLPNLLELPEIENFAFEPTAAPNEQDVEVSFMTLANLTKLKSLYLAPFAVIQDNDLEGLSNHKDLIRLSLPCEIYGEGLQHLIGLNIQELDLSACIQLTVEGIEWLNFVTSIRTLTLGRVNKGHLDALNMSHKSLQKIIIKGIMKPITPEEAQAFVDATSVQLADDHMLFSPGIDPQFLMLYN